MIWGESRGFFFAKRGRGVVSPGRREDVSVRKDAPVRRKNSAACSPGSGKQEQGSRRVSPVSVVVYQMVRMDICERK